MEILEIVGIPYFKNGSGIHIKKENRGKFTEYCGGKVTQECIDKAKKSNNPTLKKRATFAENSRGWAKKYNTGGQTPTTTKIGKEEALNEIKKWNVGNNLRHAEFKHWATTNPDAFWKEFESHQTNLRNKNFGKMAGSVTSYKPIMHSENNFSIGNTIYHNLTDGWSADQIAAVLGNTYIESEGWNKLKQNGGGPARGIFMMEEGERKKYKTWLNNREDSHANQVNYVQELFDTKDSSLKTPWDRLADTFDPKSKNKDASLLDLKNRISKMSEEQAKAEGYRSAWAHQNYTTQQAWKDWNAGDVKAKTKAFEALFERAGVPHLNKRLLASQVLRKNLDIFK